MQNRKSQICFGMDHFSISTCWTVPQYTDNLRTQFDEEKVYQEMSFHYLALVACISSFVILSVIF